MTENQGATGQPEPMTGRFILGTSVFVFGMLCPFFVPLVATSGLSTSWQDSRRPHLRKRTLRPAVTCAGWPGVRNGSTPSTGLRKFDRVFCIAHDETWAIEARVGHADKHRVVLSNISIMKLPVIDLGLYDDGTYRVAAMSDADGAVQGIHDM